MWSESVSNRSCGWLSSTPFNEAAVRRIHAVLGNEPQPAYDADGAPAAKSLYYSNRSLRLQMLERFVPVPYLEKMTIAAKSIFLLFLVIGFFYWVSAYVFEIQMFSF